MYNWSARKEVAEKVAAKYAAKAVLQGKFIAFNPYIRKKKDLKSMISASYSRN